MFGWEDRGGLLTVIVYVIIIHDNARTRIEDEPTLFEYWIETVDFDQWLEDYENNMECDFVFHKKKSHSCSVKRTDAQLLFKVIYKCHGGKPQKPRKKGKFEIK